MKKDDETTTNLLQPKPKPNEQPLARALNALGNALGDWDRLMDEDLSKKSALSSTQASNLTSAQARSTGAAHATTSFSGSSTQSQAGSGADATNRLLSGDAEKIKLPPEIEKARHLFMQLREQITIVFLREEAR
jgi:hypothetical protein